MAALPPQPPGNVPPQPPSVSPPSGPPGGPPQGPYPGGAYAPPQMAPQPYAVQPVAVAPVKVHKRTFFLTIAQLIIIVLAIVRILAGIAFIGFGVYILVAGSAHLATLPGYDQYVKQFGDAVVNLAASLFFIIGVPVLVIGIVDLVLGIVVGRPSNIARWFIIVMDVLSMVYVIDILAHNNIGSLATLIFLVYLALKVIVFYAMALDPATRRDFAGKSR
ncbi:MAG: hypothetical protein WCB51_05185 [Candidatus Dormiibacterota bacterium]